MNLLTPLEAMTKLRYRGTEESFKKYYLGKEPRISYCKIGDQKLVDEKDLGEYIEKVKSKSVVIF